MPRTATKWMSLGAALLGVYGILLFFVGLTPPAADDYGYGYGQPFSLANIFSAEVEQYFNWTGRSVVHIIARCLVTAHPIFAIVLNPLVGVALIFFSLLLLFGRCWRTQLHSWHIWLFFGLLWLSMPSFGVIFFWINGAANQLWMALFCVAFLVPLRFLYDDVTYLPPLWLRLSYPLLGLVAGWSHEVFCVIPALAGGCCCIFQWRRTQTIPLWLWLGTLLALVGCVLLLTAPGNQVRMGTEMFAAYNALSLKERLLQFIPKYIAVQLDQFPLYALTAWALWQGRRMGNTLSVKEWTILVILLLLSQGALGVLAFAPYIPPRALVGTFLFSILLAMYALSKMGTPPCRKKQFAFAMFMLLVLSSVVWQGVKLLQCQDLVSIREKALQSGVKDVRLQPYPYASKYFFVDADIEDVSHDPKHWVNVGYASAYSLNSVVREQPACPKVASVGKVVLENTPLAVELCENGLLLLRADGQSLMGPNDLKVAYVDDDVSLKSLFRVIAFLWSKSAMPEEIHDAQFLGTRFAARRCQASAGRDGVKEWMCRLPAFVLEEGLFLGVETPSAYGYSKLALQPMDK